MKINTQSFQGQYTSKHNTLFFLWHLSSKNQEKTNIVRQYGSWQDMIHGVQMEKYSQKAKMFDNFSGNFQLP